MRKKQKAPISREEISVTLNDFAAAYLFILLIQIKNAALLARNFDSYTDNQTLSELMAGYKNSAASEFALCLFDVIEKFKQFDPTYRYAKGEAIDAVIKFRRNILAHRGCNWDSKESRQVREQIAADPWGIFGQCELAAKEFFSEIHKRGIRLKPPAEMPAISTFRASTRT